MWQDIGVALGLVLAIEGILYAVAPDWMRRMLATVLSEPTETIRTVGIATAVVGAVIVWAVKSG